MDLNEPEPSWRLKLRKGLATTPYKHFTVLAEGRVDTALTEGYSCPAGPAFMGLKTWSSSGDESAQMLQAI